VNVKDHTNKGCLVVGVCYRLPDQGELVDEAFLFQLQEATRLHVLIPMGNFNHMDVCWESYTAGCEQSRRLLECSEYNIQILDKPTRGEALLDLVLISADELIKRLRLEAVWAAVTRPWLSL